MVWKRIKKIPVFRNQYVGLRNDEVERPDGEPAKYIVIENRSFVNVFCRTPDKRFLMVRQYRYPWQRFSWEPPSGIIEENEDPKNAAKREVEEETGFTVKHITLLAKVHPFAMCAGWAYVFFADVEKGGNQHLDPDEFLTWELMDHSKIDQLVKSGEFLHGMSLLGWEKVKTLLKLH